MRKLLALTAIAIVTALLAPSICLAGSNELSYLINKGNPIKVFMKDFVNESGQNQLVMGELEKTVEKSLLARKAVTFHIAKTIEQSDICISCTVKKYQYLEKGPLKFSPSPQAMLLDAAASATENYVEMDAEFVIADSRTNKTLWKDTIGFYEKKVMTPAESTPIIYDHVARRFLWKSFGKPNK
ncbi:MAG: hypothetical protein WC592_00700 [Candidatus Omnitrophota bacterium]|nr:hypothetical protein [Candidatus Omnitrophota bacterium]